MQSVYKYRFSRTTLYWTVVYLAAFGLLGWLLYHLYEGGYLSAWFTSFIVALVAPHGAVDPRRIVVTDDRVEVRCLLDITEIRRDEIASVRRVEPRRMKWFVPIFGGFGFFGYYGHFLDLRRFDRVKLYASEWKKFRGDHRHLRRPALRLVHGSGPPRGGADAARRQPSGRRGGGRRRRGGRGGCLPSEIEERRQMPRRHGF